MVIIYVIIIIIIIISIKIIIVIIFLPQPFSLESANSIQSVLWHLAH